MNPSQKILIIDDEESLRNSLARILRHSGYEVFMGASGAEARQMVFDLACDLVYLDIRLPDADGLTILREIRQFNDRLPVILLTAYGSLQTALEAMHLGATDYLLKPLDPEVLLARTRVILEGKQRERRRQELRDQIALLQKELHALEVNQREEEPPRVPPSPEARFLKHGSLILDLQTRRATFANRVVNLTPAAFDYLMVLARHAPDLVPYQVLVFEAQGYQTQPAEARELAKWHIHALRQALEKDAASPQHVLNIRGKGYRLVVD